jgi:hypothetical protein
LRETDRAGRTAHRPAEEMMGEFVNLEGQGGEQKKCNCGGQLYQSLHEFSMPLKRGTRRPISPNLHFCFQED